MQVSRIRALRGPNLWSRHTAIEAIVSCAEHECNIDHLPGFETRLRERFPELAMLRPLGHDEAVSMAQALEFAALGLQRMQVSKGALREGVLYDLLGRGGADDPREVSVEALMRRYGIDAAQASRVETTALRLFDQVATSWSLDADDRRILSRAARLHEIGLAIAHSGYHVHGAYILEHSDIAGFSQQEQRVLAALIRTHRRGIPKSGFDLIPDRLLANTRHVAALLRLAVLLHRAHETDEMPLLRLRADGERLQLALGERWLRARPLLRADLDGEPDDILGLGVNLKLSAE